MPDPVNRLQLARDEIDKVFGAGFAQQHAELVAAVMQSAASDCAAIAVARALQSIVPPGPMSALSGSERAAPKEKVRV